MFRYLEGGGEFSFGFGRAGNEFSGFNFASFLHILEMVVGEMKMALLRTISPQHMLLAPQIRNVKEFFLQTFDSHAARMMSRNAAR